MGDLAQGTFTPGAAYRTVTAMDARGNVTAETLGNGVRRTHAFDGRTGRPLGIKAGRSSASDLQDLSYQWDALGNLKSRASGSGASALAEAFGYDGLNRLTSHRVGSRPAMAASYDGYGNIRSRTGVGTYAYGADAGASGRPHAVASVTKAGSTVTHAYDANGSLTSSSDGRTVAYAAFGKAASIARGGRSSAFAHGPDRSPVQAHRHGRPRNHHHPVPRQRPRRSPIPTGRRRSAAASAGPPSRSRAPPGAAAKRTPSATSCATTSAAWTGSSTPGAPRPRP